MIMSAMAAANPRPDPIDGEIERMLDEDPALIDRLHEADRRRAEGTLDLVPHDEAMRRLGLDRRAE
jgi:hypothetical protein